MTLTANERILEEILQSKGKHQENRLNTQFGIECMNVSFIGQMDVIKAS